MDEKTHFYVKNRGRISLRDRDFRQEQDWRKFYTREVKKLMLNAVKLRLKQRRFECPVRNETNWRASLGHFQRGLTRRWGDSQDADDGNNPHRQGELDGDKNF